MSTQTRNEVRASHILVDSEARAEELKKQIEANEISFAEAAKANSSCPSGQQGGDLGFFGRGRMVPQFDQVAFASDLNVISKPVQTQFGWHLLVVTDQR